MHVAPSNASSHPVTPRWLPACLWVLAGLGLVLPWFQYLHHFLFQGGLFHRFFQDAMVNPVTTAITLDVYLAAACFSVWVWTERRVSRPVLYVVLCFSVGLAFAMPLYLLRRRPLA